MSSVQEDEEIHFAKNKESETDSLTEDDADPPPSYGSIFSLSSTQQSSDKVDVEKILSPTEDEINERNATGNFRDIATEIGQSIEDFGHRIETCALKVGHYIENHASNVGHRIENLICPGDRSSGSK